ncbi:MAG: DNA primase [Rikenellaceae bacterium]|nr:DNA primase [Rikenellaceae bacterium]
MIDNLTIDKIFSAANIVEVVGDFVTLKRKGANYQACCPFHNEKTPSFVVSPSKGLFKCFGCGKGGNAVTFVMAHENISYVDALKYVARKYNIEVEEHELTEEEVRRNDNRESMMVASSWAADYFKEQLLNGEEGRTVGMSYFRHRGVSDVSIEKFQLGYCPGGGDTMTQAALKAGYKEEFLSSTGLTIVREQGGYYDRFSGRVMFPVHSVSGRVVAFGGRTLRTDKNVAKYLNSPESEIYHKSSQLYGLFQAKRAITHDDCAILVEGYTDVISMFQSGVENVVASSGTSLTEGQIALIARFTKNVTVIYDGDAAGVKASLRGIDMILAAGLNVRVVPLPEGEDPDSFARARNSTELKEYIRSNEEDFISFKTRILLADSGGDPIRKAALITDIVGTISVIPDPITRSVFVKTCSKLLDVDEQLLVNEVAHKRISHSGDREAVEFVRRQQQQARTEAQAGPQAAIKPVKGGSSMEELEKEIIRYLLKYGESSFEYKEGKTIVEFNVADAITGDLENNGITLSNRAYDTIYRLYLTLRGEGTMDMRRFVDHPDPEVSNAAVDILTSGDNYPISKLWKRHDIVVEQEADRLSTDIPRLVLLYKSKAIEKISRQLESELAAAADDGEGGNDEAEVEIMRRIALLNREKAALAKKLSRIIL